MKEVDTDFTQVDILDLSRNELISALDKIRTVLYSYGQKTVEINDLEAEIEQRKKKEQQILTSMSKHEDKVSGIVSLSVFVFFSILGIAMGFGFLGILVFAGVITFIAYILVFLYYSKRNEKNPHPEFVAQAKEYREENIIPLQNQLFQMQKELQEWLDSDTVQWATRVVNEDYLDYSILGTFITYLKTGRADTLKEVMNLYEEEQHRARMEAMQLSATEAAQRTAAAAQRTAIASESTAKAADVSARANAVTAANIKRIRKKISRW